MARIIAAAPALGLAAVVLAAPRPSADDSVAAATYTPYLRGQFLVATPEMQDSRFRHAVIYMVDHTAEGAMGVIVNRPLGEQQMATFLGDLGIDSQEMGTMRLYYGGPVELGRIFIVHSSDWQGASTLSVTGPIALSGGRDVLRAMNAGTGPKRALIATGYAGWGPSQLESELARGDWLTAPLDVDMVFDQERDQQTKWEQTSAKAGVAL